MDQLTMAVQPQSGVASTWDYLHQLRVNNKLCDIQLLIRAKHPLEDYVDDFAVADCIQAHKLILAASSLFFRRCLDKGELLSVYNFDGIQSKNMQLLVDYMYHQVSWQEVEANEEAAEVARILEVIEHNEPVNQVDYPKDLEGNRVLIVKMQDQSIQHHGSSKMSSKTKRIIVDDIEAEFLKHDIHGRHRKKQTTQADQITSLPIMTQLDQPDEASVVTMETTADISQLQMANVRDLTNNIRVCTSTGDSDVTETQQMLSVEDSCQQKGQSLQSSVEEQETKLIISDCEGQQFDDGQSPIELNKQQNPTDQCIESVTSKPDTEGNSTLPRSSEQQATEAPSTVILVRKVEVSKTQPHGTDIRTKVDESHSGQQTNQTVTDFNQSPTFHGQPEACIKLSVGEESQLQDPLVIIPRSEEKDLSRILTSDSESRRYSTRFMGQKRVIEVTPRKMKRKRSNDGQLGEVTVTSKMESGMQINSQGPEGIGPGLKVIKLEKINEDDSIFTNENLVTQCKDTVSAVSALPSVSERDLHLNWNRSLSQSLNYSGIKHDSSFSELCLAQKSETAVEEDKSLAPSPSNLASAISTQPRRRGRPRKQKDQYHGTQLPTGAEEGDSFRCRLCGKVFKNCTGLSIHEQWKHGATDAVGNKKEMKQTTYACDYCNKVCACFQALVQHMRCIHNKTPTHKCSQCNIEFNTKRAYNTHMVQEHNMSLYRCKLCQTTFKSPEGYKIHMFKKHTEAENAFKCSKCGKTFKMKHELAIHLKITHADQRAYKCKLCTRDFKGKAALKRHLQTYHTNIRKVQCPVCSMLFKTNADMMSHQRKHFRTSQPKQRVEVISSEHKCSKCDKVFTKLMALVNHERQVHHVKGVGVTYMCTMCEKSYSTKNYLLNHIRQMHLPRRYKCQQCLYEFPYSYMLKKHLPKCKGYPIISKPYRCSRCNRYFNLKGNLTRHMRTIGRCHRAVRNYADYIVMVKSEEGDGLSLEHISSEDQTGHEDGEKVTLEALQASEALQQLQASGSGQHVDQDPNDLKMQRQNEAQFTDGAGITINQEYETVKQEENRGEEPIQDFERLKNLISLPGGLHAMNIKKDSEGNVIIEVSGDTEASDIGDGHVIVENQNALEMMQDGANENLQVIDSNEVDISHQLVQNSDGEVILQAVPTFQEMSTEDNSELQVQSVEVSESPYSHQDLYQIAPDGTLQQLVHSDVMQASDIHIVQDSSIHMIQADQTLKVIHSHEGDIHVIEDQAAGAADMTADEKGEVTL